MKKALIPFLIIALISTTSLTASANPWRPDTNEYEQSTVEDMPSDYLGNHESEPDTFIEPLSSDFDYDGVFELVSELETITKNSISIEELTAKIKDISMDDLYTKENGSQIEISDVQIFKNISECEQGKQITDGDLEDQMIVRVFYDNGESWVQYTVNPSVPSEPDSIMATSSSNPYGFTLPLDAMNLTSDLTCLYGCSNVSACSKCSANGLSAWRRKQHDGIDISWGSINGTNIRAVRAGTVFFGFNKSYGHWVKIQHTGSLSTVYAHMQTATTVSGSVSQGTILGKVGSTGDSTGPHLHFEVRNDDNPFDPLPYLKGAQPYGSSGSSGSTSELYLYAPGTYKICDGPLTLRAVPNSGTTSYGTLANGTTVNISEIQKGDDTFVFGKISSGSYKDKWIALGKTNIELYAANTSVTWRVFDGPLNIRQSASTSSQSYGTIANGSTFKITDVTKDGDFILAKIASSPSPTLASGSTCTVANAKSHWLALEYCEPVR